MKSVLLFPGSYLPGYKAGGPIRTISNLIELLGNEYEFKVIANDRDLGDKEQYPSIKVGQWNTVGKAQVFYVDGRYSINSLRKWTQETDIVYVCTIFAPYSYKLLLLNRLGLLNDKKLVVAPMGTFSSGALSLKPLKKRIFLAVVKLLRLVKGITWSVTSELEANDIKKEFGENICYVVAEDIPRSTLVIDRATFSPSGRLRVVFLSRIAKMKNLLYAIQVLQELKNKISFTIYGSLEDQGYWQKCLSELEKLPPNVTWFYGGIVSAEDVPLVFAEHDVFFLPTLGENYGHVIIEAMASGCIPVISDRTPWNDIDKMKAGFVVQLEKIDDFIAKIDALAEADSDELQVLSENAYRFARILINRSKISTGYRDIFM